VPDAHWFVVEEGVFVAVGTGEGVPDAWRDAQAKTDLAGRTVLPGFVDPAQHVVEGGLRLLAAEESAESAPNHLVARAILRAQERNLALGITAVGDDVVSPVHPLQYGRLAGARLLWVRTAIRSAPLTKNRTLVRNVGVDFLGFSDARVRFFGERFEGDRGLSEDAVRHAWLYSDDYGTWWRIQRAEDLELLVRVREDLGRRRGPDLPDVVQAPARFPIALLPRVKRQGVRLVVSAAQLLGLPRLLAGLGPERATEVVPLRALAGGGLEPALASEWPRGHGDLGPLGMVALAASGRAVDGTPIEGFDSRTLSLGDAIRAVTRWAAAAIGRGEDLGRIAPGYRADFLVLYRSPWAGDPHRLYQERVDATYSNGEAVYAAHNPAVGVRARDPEADARRFGATPLGWTVSPILGYDPVPGPVVGGAIFVYPYEDSGIRGSVQFGAAPLQGGRVFAVVQGSYLGVTRWLDLHGYLLFNNLVGDYYGFGIDTAAGDLLSEDRTRIYSWVGPAFQLGHGLELGAQVVYGFTHLKDPEPIRALGGAWEGDLDGHRLGLRAELIHDDRSSTDSSRYGGRRRLWAEAWGLQGTRWAPRGRIGFDLSQFIPLYAPDLVLALRAEGGVSFGEPTYDTNYDVGGIYLLRGFNNNRFRGQYYAALGAELRFPIWFLLSGAAFCEAAMVWGDGHPSPWEKIGVVGGGGLRIGLPPDYLVKLRLDVGFGRDQWGIFFAFNEAF
jgi:predicted amidohydrolase YtcJ